jgi:O-antigen/teichoic acid export membrane protein
MFFGFNGVAIASALISLSLVIVVYLVKKHINFDLIKSSVYPLIASFIMAITVYISAKIFVSGLVSLLAIIILGVFVYFVTIFLIAGKQLKADVKLVMVNIKK